MSRFLVDTQLLLWNVYGSRKLPARVSRLFRDGRHQFFYSAASLWEIAIKAGRGREDFVADAAAIRDALEENGFHELPVAAQHAVALSTLPAIHGDPFDRMLVASRSSSRWSSSPPTHGWPRGVTGIPTPVSCISSLSPRGGRAAPPKWHHRNDATQSEAHMIRRIAVFLSFLLLAGGALAEDAVVRGNGSNRGQCRGLGTHGRPPQRGGRPGAGGSPRPGPATSGRRPGRGRPRRADRGQRLPRRWQRRGEGPDPGQPSRWRRPGHHRWSRGRQCVRRGRIAEPRTQRPHRRQAQVPRR